MPASTSLFPSALVTHASVPRSPPCPPLASTFLLRILIHNSSNESKPNFDDMDFVSFFFLNYLEFRKIRRSISSTFLPPILIRKISRILIKQISFRFSIFPRISKSSHDYNIIINTQFLEF